MTHPIPWQWSRKILTIEARKAWRHRFSRLSLFSFRARRTAEKVRVRESVSGGRVAWQNLVLGTPKSSFCCECDLPLVLSLLPRGRRRPLYFFFLSALEMRNFGNRGFLLRQLAKSQSRKLRPESRRRDLQTRSSEAWVFHDHPGTFMINQTRKTAQLLCPMAMERWAGGRSGGLGRSSDANFPHFPAEIHGNTPYFQ